MIKRWIILCFICAGLSACTSFSSERNLKEDDHSKSMTVIEKVIERNIPPIPSEPLKMAKEPKNFLLIGVDSRGEENSRSDTIMLARYEPADKKIKLVSLMRDSYVKIPNHPLNYSKLNHAYYLGGKDLLKQTVEQNFGVTIDHIAVIDFKGFISMMNTIAPNGLEVEVSQIMIDDMNLSVKPGKQKLQGEDLLSFVRFRHDDMNDFGRVNRQQEVLISLKDQTIKQFATIDGIARFPEMIKHTMQNVETDLKFDEAFSLGASFLLNPVNDVQTLRVPISNSFENKHYQHAGSVLQLDFMENEEAIKDFLHEK
ncbi:LCP family protein [Bacillus sp. DTU_2020_1000418_1_SI_GHA_SEK_038]|uniref:LCP family protein n=1 Tax=Bacillus sp. DTU_2020_1000418_1_SI_GHA_SEK_038 TaxID=3077585 RepID=UPI0028EEFB04|nr:LCP family protein [Bacillus sp. DTU_2020_1000418_1_SI_GHA_SEK_038]WNS73877.1 LCP family protein [Bacillus sp. DTU_2020_1000418_1_SI_GHA_SEK_038]